jgi:alpha-ribazole phosphatase
MSATATRVTFVRHAQSVANAGGVAGEHALIPLTALGVAQARRVAQVLPAEPTRIFVSSFLRARQTAEPYCRRTGREPEIHPLLHECSALDPNLLVGLTGEERAPIAQAYWQTADPLTRHGAGAETFLEFEARIRAFIAELPALPAGCVLFGHGIWFALLWWKLQGLRVDDSAGMTAFARFRRKLPMPNCAIYMLERTVDGTWHLTADERAMLEIAMVSIRTL